MTTVSWLSVLMMARVSLVSLSVTLSERQSTVSRCVAYVSTVHSKTKLIPVVTRKQFNHLANVCECVCV